MSPIVNLTSFDKQIVLFFLLEFKSLSVHPSGFGGLEVSALAFGTQVHGLKPG
jgi:hypothetical protein